MSATIGHPGALRRLACAHPEASEAKAVAMVTVPSTSLWAGPQGLERGSGYLLALFPTRLVLLRPRRRPSPEALLAEFPRKVYRINDVTGDLLNLSFYLVLPYGQMQVKMGRRGPYAVNAEAEAQVIGRSARKDRLAHRPALLLAAFPDRVLLLDRNRTTHIASTPVAAFAKGECRVTVTASDRKHVDLTLAGAVETVSVRISRYGEQRIDGLVLDAILAMNGPSTS
ncbi:MAG TPA: hypothetical protein VMZ00_09790 [Sporichthya sp.]|nr:hypothetical protein [Sporichthya sp.]